MDIFQLNRPLKSTRFDISEDFVEPSLYLLVFLLAENTHVGQHSRMSLGALDILFMKALIKIDRGSKAGNKGVSGFAKAAAPGLIG